MVALKTKVLFIGVTIILVLVIGFLVRALIPYIGMIIGVGVVVVIPWLRKDKGVPTWWPTRWHEGDKEQAGE